MRSSGLKDQTHDPRVRTSTPARLRARPRNPDGTRRRRTEGDALGEVRLRERNYRRGLATSDVIATAASIVIGLQALGGEQLRPAFVLALPFVVIVAKLQGLYDRDELVVSKSTLDEIPRLFHLATLLALTVWLSRHFFVLGAPSTADLLALWAIMLGSLTGGRMLARRLAARTSPPERCLLLGGDKVFSRLAARLADDRNLVLVRWEPLDQVLNRRARLEDLVEQDGIQRIIIAPGEGHGTDIVDVIRAAKATGLRVSLLPGILATVGSSVVFDDLGGIVLLGVPRFGLSQSSALLKRTLDLVGSTVLLFVTSPFILLAVVAIKRGSPGPVFFRQTRIGRNGEPFSMIKLRTMVDGADALKPTLVGRNEAVGLFKIDRDPRITRAGRWLRRTHLDELPQLINVIRSEMSLVGPRPLIVEEDETITGTDRRRLHLTPGMTGQWQILGAARVPLAEMVKLDYLYVANWSLWGDMKILARTVPAMVGRRGQ